MLHRDIKPANLLLDNRGSVWITDFGLAKASDQQNLTHTGDILGTLRYMPPEAFEGKADARGDVYSLGLTLFELLAFRPAFGEKDRNRLVKQVTTDEPPRLGPLCPGLPRDLETIIHKAIERDPNHRYATASDLAADLQRFLGDEPIRARRATVVERYVRWARRNPVIATLGAILTAVLLAATGASLLAANSMANLARQQARAARNERDARFAAERDRQSALQARTAALAALREADTQRQFAEENFQQARRAVDRYFTQVSENQLLSVPGLQTLRGELLGSALAFYQDFLKRRGQDPLLRSTLAAVHLKAATIERELGRPSAAEQGYRAALALFDALAQSEPTNVEIVNGLAECHLALGEQGTSAPSRREHLQKAIALREELKKSHAADARLRADLARSHQALGDLEVGALSVREALDSFLKAREIVATLVRDEPERPSYQYDFARNLAQIAECLCKLGRHPDETIVRPFAIEHARTAFEQAPQVVEYGRLYGRLNFREASNMLSQKRVADGDRALRRAIAVQSGLARANPAVPALAGDLVATCARLSVLLSGMNRSADAVKLLGDTTAELEQVSREAPHLDVAMARLLALRSETGDQTQPVDLDRPRRSRDADRAVLMLKRAIAAGLPDVASLEKLPDLAKLRSRDDVKTILANAAAAAPAHGAHRFTLRAPARNATCGRCRAPSGRPCRQPASDRARSARARRDGRGRRLAQARRRH